jgi:hypothetical protein
VWISPLHCAFYMPLPSHPPWFDHSSSIRRRIHIMELLIMQFSSNTCHFISSEIQIFSYAVCSQTPSICVLPLMWDQVWHPYKTTGKILVLYVLIFTFLDSSWGDKRLWTVHI